jgi:signal transduction histidine kinase
MPESRRIHELARLDAAAVFGLTVLSILLSAHFQLAEALFAFTRRWEYLQLDELPIGLLVLAIGLIWLSWRRYRQAGRELRARQRAEARLAGVLEENRRLAQERLRIQELERKHLALELHDELGQYLNAIKLDATSISDSDGSDGSDAGLSIQASRSIIRSVDHVHAAVSDMIRRLRPVGLDELGLVPAIEYCVDHWRQRLPDTRFALEVQGEFGRIDESLKLTLYRLIQEGLTNIYKHASARQVEIVLALNIPLVGGMDELLLRVTDDGRGLDTAARTGGFGLSGMRERVELAGGTFLLKSSPGGGFSFEARIPSYGG